MSEAELVRARIEVVTRVEGGSPITADIGEITVERGVDGLVDEGDLSDAMSQLFAAAAEVLAVDRAGVPPGLEREGGFDGDSADC